MQKNQWSLLLLSFILLPPAFAKAAPSCAEAQGAKKETTVAFRRGRSVYDAFRSNANDYWNWSRTQFSKYVSKDLLTEGLIAGDPHAMNFGDLYLQGEKVKITLVDLDDAGRAPYLVDFARLLTAIKLSGADVKSKEAWENYLDGLYGRRPEEVPSFIENISDKTHADWLGQQKEFIANNTINNHFNMETLRLKPLRELSQKDQSRAQQLVAKVSEINPRSVVKDVAYRIKEDGGSQGLLRIWVLVDTNGVFSINEFKEMAIPATQFFEPQADSQKQRFAEVTKTFWGNADPVEYKVVSIDGGDFWMRPRYKYDLKFNPEKIDSDKKQKKFDQWNLYTCYILGRMHGAQIESLPLQKALRKQSDSAIEQIKEFSKAYRQRLGDFSQ